MNELIKKLYDELIISGYSLMYDDIKEIAEYEVMQYKTWSDRQDYGILYPVIRRHCDLLQARRMEGSVSMGATTVGLSVSEATSLYHDSLEQMKREAFHCTPFSVSWDDDELTKLNNQLDEPTIHGSIRLNKTEW